MSSHSIFEHLFFGGTSLSALIAILLIVFTGIMDHSICKRPKIIANLFAIIAASAMIYIIGNIFAGIAIFMAIAKYLPNYLSFFAVLFFWVTMILSVRQDLRQVFSLTTIIIMAVIIVLDNFLII